MAQPRRRLPQAREIPWTELRRRAFVVFLMLQAGWNELTADEREEARRLVSKSRGRPRNLTRHETSRLGKLAGRAARAAAGARPKH
jgi:alkylhydroperoxidase family enzyme